MKRTLIGVALAAACAIVSACATVTAVNSTPDAAAIRLERSVAAVAVTLTAAVDDPASGIDPADLAERVAKAAVILRQGRAAFDARTGDPVTLANQALDIVSSGLPAKTSPRVGQALLAGRLALSVYAANIVVTGEASPPSAELVAARGYADGAIDGLLDRLDDER